MPKVTAIGAIRVGLLVALLPLAICAFSAAPVSLFDLQQSSQQASRQQASRTIDAAAEAVWAAQWANGPVQPTDPDYRQKLRRSLQLAADWERQRAALGALWAIPGQLEDMSLQLTYWQDANAVQERVDTQRIIRAPIGVAISVDDLRHGAKPDPAFGNAPRVVLFQGRALAVTAHRVAVAGVLKETSTQALARRAGSGYAWGTEFDAPTWRWRLAVTAIGGSGTLAVVVRIGTQPWRAVPCTKTASEQRCHALFTSVRAADVITFRVALPYEGSAPLDALLDGPMETP